MLTNPVRRNDAARLSELLSSDLQRAEPDDVFQPESLPIPVTLRRLASLQSLIHVDSSQLHGSHYPQITENKEYDLRSKAQRLLQC